MAKNTSISLGRHFDEFVARQVAQGRYGSASEVIRAGPRKLEDEEHDISKFYSLLNEDIVEWVFIVPLQMDFDGKIFPADKNKKPFTWKGQRASILYAVLIKKDNLSPREQQKREEQFLETVGSIEKTVQSSRIRCKPLEKGVIFSVRKLKKIE